MAQGFIQSTDNRDNLTEYHRMKEGDWDEGWGWVRYNDGNGSEKPFVKMLNSGLLMMAGLNDNLQYQRDWLNSRLITSQIDTSASISTVSRSESHIDLVYRTVSRELIYNGLRESTFDDWLPDEANYTLLSKNLSPTF